MTILDYKVRRLSQAGQSVLANIIPALEALRPGSAFTITDTPERITSIRSYLYTHLTSSGQKLYFRVTRESASTLRVLCRDLTPAAKPLLAFSLVETFVLDNLLSASSLDEASAIAQVALSSNQISDQDFVEIIEEWERKVGPQGEAKVGAEKITRVNPLNGFIEDKGGEENG